MAPDDRDRMFDKALSRHLRSVAGAPAAADLPSAPGSPSSLCLDPEMLAAYHERSLLPEEMNSVKEHIVSCAHCQAILAQLEMTDSIPLAASEKEKVLAAAALPAAKPALAEKSASPRPIRRPRWAWLVPAGALAAGLLVWVGLHEKQFQHSPAASEVKVVARAQEPAPLPSLEKSVPALTAPQSDQLEANSRAREAVGALTGGVAGAVPKAPPAAHENLKQPSKADSIARIAGAPLPADKESELRKDAARDSIAQLTAQNQPASDLKGVASASGAAALDQNALQNQTALNQNVNIVAQNQMITPKVPGPAPLGQASQAEVTKKAKSAAAASRYSSAPAAPAPPPVPSEVSAFSDTATGQGAGIANPHLIAVPGSPVRWLAGGAGLIEFSLDHGASWSVQTSGVTVDLFTGSAPTDKICWMVGRAGTIVLTTDGGAHWSTVASPLKEDLGGIRALDALHATVWNPLKTKSFETSDGGVTWKLVPAP